MIRRLVPWATVTLVIVTLVWAGLPPPARGQPPGTAGASDRCDVLAGVDVSDGFAETIDCPGLATTETPAVDGDDKADEGGDVAQGAAPGRANDGTAERTDPCPDDALDVCLATSIDEPVPTGGPAHPSQGIAAVSESPGEAADPTSIEVYCDIPNASMPDQRIVGTFVNPRAGFGDPTVTFTLFDLAGNPIVGNGPPPVTGSPPLPASNPITATPPSTWEWGPGGYSRLTVSATYPSLDPAGEDFNTSLSISCVPEAPTPTPPPFPTPDPSWTPTPTPVPAGYTPRFATEMRDTAGNVIPDGATVAPGTGVIDIATISGLPPGTTGSIFYQLWRDNCSVYLGVIGPAVSVVADANGVAIAPSSPVFTAPGFPGGFYDWRIVYFDAATTAYSGCGFETFFVPPPPPDQGTGNARLTCFLLEPPEPGRAGYKINISPLPATGTVEVNVTLQLDPGSNIYEYKTVTLPPGTLQDLEFYGAYTYAWANIIFRDDAGEVDAVLNLEGACAATPGPTPTPAPTAMPTATVMPTATSAPTETSTSAPTETSTGTTDPSTAIPPSTATGTTAATITATTTSPASTATVTTTALETGIATARETKAPTRTPAPTSTPALPVAHLPDTGAGDSDTTSSTRTLLLVVVATILAGCAVIAGRGSVPRRD